MVYMLDLTAYEQTLLDGWEDVYRKSQLTLWLLLALREGEKHMAEIKSFIADATNKLLSPDDKSMYRTLRRLTAAEIIIFSERAATGGPDYKIYKLTTVGQRLLSTFVQRNIIDIYYDQHLQSIIKKG